MYTQLLFAATVSAATTVSAAVSTVSATLYPLPSTLYTQLLCPLYPLLSLLHSTLLLYTLLLSLLSLLQLLSLQLLSLPSTLYTQLLLGATVSTVSAADSALSGTTPLHLLYWHCRNYSAASTTLLPLLLRAPLLP